MFAEPRRQLALRIGGMLSSGRGWTTVSVHFVDVAHIEESLEQLKDKLEDPIL